jgi:hypothetical protein
MKSDQSNQYEPCPREKIPPEILEWARQTFDEQEFLTQVREIKTTAVCGWKTSSPSWRRERDPSE